MHEENLSRQKQRHPQEIANDIGKISILARGILNEASPGGEDDALFNEAGKELSQLGYELHDSELKQKKVQDEAAAKLAQELEIAEDIQRRIDELRAINNTSNKKEKTHEKTADLEGSRVGWLTSNENFSINLEEINSGDLAYFFGSIIEQDNVASKALRRLREQGEEEALKSSLQKTVLPKLWKQIVSGDSRARPISIGNRSRHEVRAQKSLNTTYPAYKVGVHGTNNRAIVLLINKVDEKPVFVLAALYDHEDQAAVLSHMYLKPGRKK